MVGALVDPFKKDISISVFGVGVKTNTETGATTLSFGPAYIKVDPQRIKQDADFFNQEMQFLTK